MIISIALGIVLAVVILNFLPEILELCLWLFMLAIGGGVLFFIAACFDK